MQAFENALFASNYTDPTDGYRQYLDEVAFIDWYLLKEVTKEQDAFFSSAYFFKDRGEKLTFGPMWDFDMSIGSTLGIMDNNPTGWWARDKGP